MKDGKSPADEVKNMTKNETIKSIISKFEKCERDGTDYFDEKLTAKECGIVISSLEKQIPEKPGQKELATEQPFKVAVYTIPCGNCGEALNRLHDYCPWCGQAIDWSNENDE